MFFWCWKQCIFEYITDSICKLPAPVSLMGKYNLSHQAYRDSKALIRPQNSFIRPLAWSISGYIILFHLVSKITYGRFIKIYVHFGIPFKVEPLKFCLNINGHSVSVTSHTLKLPSMIGSWLRSLYWNFKQFLSLPHV